MVKKRKPMHWLLIALLLITLLPSAVLGASPGVKPNPQTSISLEKAIEIVKGNFTIPSDLSEFSSSFQDTDGNQVWRLNWRAKVEDKGEFTAAVDAASSEVTNINYWKPRNNSDSRVPGITVMQAQQTGQQLLNRLLPNKTAYLQMEKDTNLITLDSYSPSTYRLSWKRIYHNIPVGNDRVSMEIDMQNGQVLNYYLSWTDTKLPEPAQVISSDKARQIFADKQLLKLKYFCPDRIKPYRSGQQLVPQPQLVYAVQDPSQGMIDAFTGIPISGEYFRYWDEAAGMGKNNEKMLALPDGQAPTAILSPEEQREVETSKKFISQEQAIQMVKKWVNIPPELELQSAILEPNWRETRLRNWNLSWQSKSAAESIKRLREVPLTNMWAQVDASSGELISFNISQPPADNKSALNQAAAQELADNFVKNIQSQRWQQLKLDNSDIQVSQPKTSPASWSFNYQRLVNGVIFPDDGIRIIIDASSQQIINYSLNWTKADFPGIDGLVDTSKANQLYLQAAPLKLGYIFPQREANQPEAKLVYMPQSDQGVSMIDAKSGTVLDSEGSILVPKLKACDFKDIKGHYGEKEIALLGQAGIFTEYGDSFHPDENLKLNSLLRAMLAAREGIYGVKDIDDKELSRRCQNMGWIKADMPLNTTVSRELLAQLMVRFLNIDFLTQVQGIYKLPYKDAASLSSTTQACAALTWGLGIIKADGKNFNPGHTVSRGEGASVLVHTLSVKTQSY